MNEIEETREALGNAKDRLRFYESYYADCIYEDEVEYDEALSALARIESRVAELTKDRDYWQALAMQFHDAVHAEIERRAKVEI